MPFTPLRLLLVHDSMKGLTPKVVPEMVRRLEQRAFLVDVYDLEDVPSEVDPFDYAGVILGTPTFGLGWKGVGPTQALTDWVKAQGGLDDIRIAAFCVFQARAGNTLRNLRQLCVDEGANVVVAQPYGLLNLEEEAHVLPAECMVRIR